MEIEKRISYLGDQEVNTIYFGGGTPSVLQEREVREILKELYSRFKISDEIEISFEANPDDLTREYLQMLKRSGVNRLSVGIQSFSDELLVKMNRRHSAKQAVQCIEEAYDMGFENISTDLIYGLPGMDRKEWERNLQMMLNLPIQHLSAYHLTYHEGTAFYTWLKKGTLRAVDEGESVEQFEILIDQTEKMGFEQYEISNFARNKKYSRHNSSYWMGKDYLGLGPSAHSFNGNSRQWNVSHVEAYIKALENDQGYYEIEELDMKAKYNEYILTGIRTIWGISIQLIHERFGENFGSYFEEHIETFKEQGLLRISNGIVQLSRKGQFVSDDIMTELMMV